MRLSLTLASSLLTALALNAAPVLTIGTPGNSLRATPTLPSPSFGPIINFDSLTPGTSLAANTFTSSGILSISSPDGLLVEPYSTQSDPNEIFDNSADGTANLTITLVNGTTKLGIGIADSDPVTITLEALLSNGAVLGSPFTVNIANTGDPTNPGNGYYVITDTTSDIYGLKILQTSGNASAYSGLAIDDLQVAVGVPEPGCLALLGAVALLIGALRSRRSA